MDYICFNKIGKLGFNVFIFLLSKITYANQLRHDNYDGVSRK